MGSHWRTLYEVLRGNGSIGAEELRRVAVRYPFPDDALLDVPDSDLVEDPLAVDFELRYPVAAHPRRGAHP